MNFGQNLYNWFLSNAQSLVLLAIVVIDLYLRDKIELEFAVDNKAIFWNAWGKQRRSARVYFERTYSLK